MNKDDTGSGSSLREFHGLNVVFMGGKQAGCIGLLTICASGCRVQGVVAYDDLVKTLAAELDLLVFDSISQPEVKNVLSNSDILVSVHGREIVPAGLFSLPRLGAINVHPCLVKYKGASPVRRLLEDGGTRASVGVHRMAEKVDEGEVLLEEFLDISGKKSVDEVYNALYPLYSLIILRAMKMLVASG